MSHSRYVEDMTMEAIREAITHLSEPERRQLESDFSPGGRGIAWGERVKADIAAGNFTSLEEGLRLRGELRAKR